MALSNEQIEAIRVILPDFEATDETTLDDVKQLAGSRFIDVEIHRKEVDAAFGKARGTAESKFKKFLGEVAKGKNFEEMTELIEQRINGFKTELEELKKTKPSKANDADIERLQTELEQYKSMAAEANQKVEQLSIEVESARAEGETKLSQYLLNQAVQFSFAGANWVDAADNYVKQGVWNAEIEGKYSFKKEGDRLLVYDSEGNIVKDGTQHMTADKLFETILKKANKYKNSQAKGVTVGNKVIEVPGDSTKAAQVKRMLEHAAKLKAASGK